MDLCWIQLFIKNCHILVKEWIGMIHDIGVSHLNGLGHDPKSARQDAFTAFNHNKMSHFESEANLWQFGQMCLIKGDILALRKSQSLSAPVWTVSIGISKVCAWDWIDNYPQSRLLKAGPSAGDWQWLFPNAHAVNISPLAGSNGVRCWHTQSVSP